MNQLEIDLKVLGVLEKTAEIVRSLGPEAGIRLIQGMWRVLAGVCHPDMNPGSREAATRLMQQLNEIKPRIEALQPQSLAAALGLTTNPVPGHPRVLVVEDEEGLRENLAELLMLEGYHVASAANGVGGLKLFSSFRPELVITDVVMPLMSGVEMVRHMRRRDPSVRVIFMSGFFGSREIKAELMAEMERYGYPMLSKPFRPGQLFEMVRRLLG